MKMKYHSHFVLSGERIVKMINILIFFMCLATSSYTQRVDGMQSTLEDLELERQLKLINKLPVKSINTKYGYIVDCIEINNQPAFDHPLLKNHMLQKKPSFQPTKAKSSSLAKSKTEIFEKVVCPTRTVPIRRTTKDDLIRAKSLLNTNVLTQDNNGSHVAEVYLVPYADEVYYGVSGVNSIYNPKVNKDQTSAAHIWVQNGEADGINKIFVGWHVSPQLHGDDATYVYTLWTSDNFKKTGCYNLQCPGFIQTAQEYLFIGISVNNTSVYGGEMIEMTVSLSKDADTNNWWLNIGNITVGYFPAALFSNMISANQVGWGGKTTTPVGTPNPQMGSGYFPEFPDPNFVHASYFRNVAFQNDQSKSRKDYGPENFDVETFTDKPDCFGVDYYGNLKGEVGYSLQFGGPGGECGN